MDLHVEHARTESHDEKNRSAGQVIPGVIGDVFTNGFHVCSR